MPAALRTSTFAILLAALFGAATAAAQGGPPRLLGPTVGDRVMVNRGDAVVQARVVQPDVAAIHALARRHLDVGDFQTFVLDLFDGMELEAEVVYAEVRANGTTLHGRLTEFELGSAVLTYEGGVLVGTVSLPGASYMIERQPDGLYRVARIATQLFPRELPPEVVFFAPQAGNDFAVPDIPADSGRLIDVLVLWTPAAQTAAGGAVPMAALAQSMVDNTNQIYRNSGIAHRMRLVHSELVAYTERNGSPGGCAHPFGGSNGNSVFQCALYDISGTADGFMDAVHALRNTHGADLVALLIEDNSSCGLAWLTNPPTSTGGFSVSARDCALANRTFAHETGHNLGAQHDPYPSALPSGACADGFAPGLFCYSRGIVNLAQQWRTVMAYTDQCDDNATTCPKIDFFSNPNLTHVGSPIGTAAFNNNAHTLNKTAKAVASFRPIAAALHPIPQRFGDVAASHPFYGYIEFFGQAGITTGCGGGLYCPDGTVTRRAMAAFLERVKRAPEWTPPVAVGLFNDVPIGDVFAPWIEALFNDGITSGCGGGAFCPDNNVTRGQMAVFILRAKCGNGYLPNLPAVQRFLDVPPSHPFYRFIDKFATLGITSGCGNGNYCPDNSVTRGQMATFIERGYPAEAPSELCSL